MDISPTDPGNIVSLFGRTTGEQASRLARLQLIRYGSSPDMQFRGRTMTDAAIHAARPTISCDAPTQETIPLKGGGGRVALMMIVFGFLIVSPIALLSEYMAAAIYVIVFVSALVVVFTGVPGFYRRANCLKCGTEVTLNATKPGTDCPGCKTRIVLKKERFEYPYLSPNA